VDEQPPPPLQGASAQKQEGPRTRRSLRCRRCEHVSKECGARPNPKPPPPGSISLFLPFVQRTARGSRVGDVDLSAVSHDRSRANARSNSDPCCARQRPQRRSGREKERGRRGTHRSCPLRPGRRQRHSESERRTLDRSLSLVVRLVGDEAETARASCLPVRHDDAVGLAKSAKTKRREKREERREEEEKGGRGEERKRSRCCHTG